MTLINNFTLSTSSYPTPTVTKDAAASPVFDASAPDTPPQAPAPPTPEASDGGQSQPTIYTALANANTPTIRGSNLDIQA